MSTALYDTIKYGDNFTVTAYMPLISLHSEPLTYSDNAYIQKAEMTGMCSVY
jgi:hypothetical protein